MELNSKIKKAVDGFVEQLRLSLGANLVCVSLYGSAASGEHVKKHSDINVLIILEKTNLASLQTIAALKRKVRFKDINPLVFTRSYLDSSTDTFPIEFLDLKENHIVLSGEDCLKNLKIGLANLRHQCEWELKSKLVQMQKFYINSQGSNRALKEFLLKGLPSFIVVFRNILRLKSINTSCKEETLGRIAEEFDLDKDVLNRLWQARTGCSKMGDVRNIFERFMLQIQHLSDSVDKLPPGKTYG